MAMPPRLRPKPTGHPSPDAAALIGHFDPAALLRLRDRAVADAEDRIRQVRDLDHVCAAYYDTEYRAVTLAAWQVAIARAVGDPSPAGCSLRTLGDVTNLGAMSVRQHAAYGRGLVDEDERRALEAGVAQRRNRRRIPPAR